MVNRQPEASDLPPYLGFGRLDTQSIQIKDGILSARYYDDSGTVYTIQWSGEQCWLKEIYDGEENGQTIHTDLHNAFVHHFLSIEPKESKRFRNFIKNISRIGNVYATLPARNEREIFYPAGHIFVLRQPIIKSNRSAFERFKKTIKTMENLIKIDSERPGVIFRLIKDDKAGFIAVLEDIVVVDMTTTLVEATKAVKICCDAGLVPAGKVYRLTLTDCTLSFKYNLAICPGEPEKGYFAFSVFPIEQNGLTAEQATNLFIKAATEFLNQKKQ